MYCSKVPGRRSITNGCNGAGDAAHDNQSAWLECKVADAVFEAVTVTYHCHGNDCDCPPEGHLLGEVGPLVDESKLENQPGCFDRRSQYNWNRFVAQWGALPTRSRAKRRCCTIP